MSTEKTRELEDIFGYPSEAERQKMAERILATISLSDFDRLLKNQLDRSLHDLEVKNFD